MRKIGLFGGAFDPVHEGHIHIATLALNRLGLDQIVFIPVGIAVHKKQPEFPTQKRFELLKKAIQHNAKFVISTVEIDKKAPGYAIDTIRALTAPGAEYTGVDLYYIIGTDAFEQIFTWKEPEALLTAMTFIVVARPGYDFMTIERLFTEPAREKYLDKVLLIEDVGIALSSTKIRESYKT